MDSMDRRRRAMGGTEVSFRRGYWQRARVRTGQSQTKSDRSSSRRVVDGVGVRSGSGEIPGVGKARRAARDGMAEVLQALEALYAPHRDMDQVLRIASQLVAEVVSLDHCSIAFFDKNASGFRHRASHTREGVEVDQDHVAKTLADYVRRVPANPVEHVTLPGAIRRNREADQVYELTAPLRIDGQIVGYLYGLRKRFSDPQFLDTDRSLFIALSQHINVSIEGKWARESLGYPYVATMPDAMEKRYLVGIGAEKAMFLDSVRSREDFARWIGRELFGDLHRAGFEARHIVSVATEIIDNLNSALRNPAAVPRDCQL